MTDRNSQQMNRDNVQYVAISPEMLNVNNNNDDEIDLRELWNVIWEGKWIIILITAIFVVASVFYALSLPNIYKSEALLAPASAEKQGGLGGLGGQLGGLASLAGVRLGGGSTDKTGLAIEILKSREFFAKFATKYNILPDLMASKGFDPLTKRVIYDYNVYIEVEDKWVREVKLPKSSKPSFQEAKKEFEKIVKINKNVSTGMVSIGIEHFSPFVAKQWVDWLIEDINLVMKSLDKKEAERSIVYLRSQLSQTNIADQKALLYQLIEEQSKTLMLTAIRDEYAFKIIDLAIVPEEKVKPKRALIVIFGFILGGVAALISLLFKYFFLGSKSNENINSLRD